MFILLVHVEVRPAMLDDFMRAIGENARASLAHDPGCLRFEVLQDSEVPTRWVFYEAYVDETAWQHHRRSPHFLAYQAVADRALVSRVATKLTPLSVPEAS